MTVETDLGLLKSLTRVRGQRDKEIMRRYRSILEFEIELGDKHLTLAIGNRQDGKLQASTKIRKSENLGYLPGATTAVYSCAKDLMQSFADRTKRTIHYEAATRNEKMKAWIRSQDHGEGLFDWEELTEDDAEILHAKKTINPSL